MQRSPLFVALVCCAVCVHGQNVRIKRLDGTTIAAADAEAFARKTLAEHHVTGAQIAVINRGRPVWSAAFGLAGRTPDRNMSRTTTTWAGSLTKAVFATYVMSLVERSEFNLDEPVTRQLAHPLDTYEPYRESAALLVKDARWPAVTPRMLLSHTSSLANFAMYEPDKKLHLHADPGAQYRYSREGINLLQFVLEQKLKKPLDELMQAAIFSPLEMKRTAMIYRTDLGTDVADRFDSKEAFIAKTRRFPARAAGSMTTDADDMATFLAALLDNRIIQSKTRADMLRPTIAIHSVHQFDFGTDKGPPLEADNVSLAYGLGWTLLTRTPFGPAFSKEGHGDGAQNYMICFEKSQDCMVLLTNSDNGELAFRALLEHLLGDTATPWEWEGFTPAYIEASRKNQ